MGLTLVFNGEFPFGDQIHDWLQNLDCYYQWGPTSIKLWPFWRQIVHLYSPQIGTVKTNWAFMLELLGQMKPFKGGGQMVSPFQFLIAIPTIGHNRQRQTTMLLLEDITFEPRYILGVGGAEAIYQEFRTPYLQLKVARELLWLESEIWQDRYIGFKVYL